MTNSYFSYFTHLSYIGICAYFWASGVQTFSYSRRWKKAGAGVGYPLQRQPGILRCMHMVLQSTVVTFRTPSSLLSFSSLILSIHLAILVTIVFWALLSGPSTFETVYSCSPSSLYCNRIPHFTYSLGRSILSRS